MKVRPLHDRMLVRRIEEKIYDPEEFKRAHAWVRQNCPEGKDYNAERRSRRRKDWEWEFVVKSAMIVRDLMIGPPSGEARIRRGGSWAQRDSFWFSRPAALDRIISRTAISWRPF